MERMEVPVVKLSPKKDAHASPKILMSEKTSSRCLLQNRCSNQCQVFFYRIRSLTKYSLKGYINDTLLETVPK